MRCEVCGRKIHNDPIRANIEGAKLTVCAECAKHGKIIYPDEEKQVPKSPFLTVASGSGSTSASTTTGVAKAKRHPQMMQKKRNLVAKVEITQELIEGYAAQIRVAREKLGLSHEDLGLKINERASVLKHIELGKMEPNNLLAGKLERLLKIKLLVPIEKEEESSIPTVVVSKNQEMTLGDLIEVDSNTVEEPKKRKQS
ncbi:MAG: multiprotein bridging factor aMBF1 [Nitrososphaerota archaeon]|nr:multiprotein bridging factor aMBF1 [Nitrososphaerota archaeon]